MAIFGQEENAKILADMDHFLAATGQARPVPARGFQASWQLAPQTRPDFPGILPATGHVLATTGKRGQQAAILPVPGARFAGMLEFGNNGKKFG